MNILLLAAGGSIAEYEVNDYPITLSEFNGRPLIQHLVEVCLGIDDNINLIIAFKRYDIQKFYLDNIVQILAPSAKIIAIEKNTKGAACTALLAMPYIDNNDELLILNANDYLQLKLKEPILNFRERGLDAGTLTFDSIHPRYSYVRLEKNLVIEAAEKRPISRHATAGFYWFKHGNEFVAAAKRMIYKDSSLHGIFYICPTFNELILNQKNIGIYEIDNNLYHPIKDERQFNYLEASKK
ncbi:glycosyltransferase family 2 protein [Acinetobacter junii]|uniref:glycosyltransferase family 2 protein n=1 Tax=Acinetobacter junii TaxID=40215 RepID=UPI00285F87B4|nr:glycosyltransferase family 2 protein [Acinetobacter junii]MDR7655210.1 glycosyltransferase family 2 protein [Acinetobacter junii]